MDVNKKQRIEELKQKIAVLENTISQLNVDQGAVKVLANSGYGALGNAHFRYFKIENAEAITYTGQWIIKVVEKRLNEYLNEIIGFEKDRVLMMDTDSVYICLNDLVNLVGKENIKTDVITFIESFAQECVSEQIDQVVKVIEKKISSLPDILSMKLECIGDKIIITRKKRYIMNVSSSEGVRYPKPKKKIKGIESVRSSTPPKCRNWIRETIDDIFLLDNAGVIKKIEEIKKRIINESDISSISFPRGINGLEKYYDPVCHCKLGTPKQVRAALRFNRFIKENNLIHKYQPIRDGDKVMFACLKLPNTLNEEVVAWNTNTPPKELQVERFIDREEHFKLGFMNPIETILEVIGWESEKSSRYLRFLLIKKLK